MLTDGGRGTTRRGESDIDGQMGRIRRQGESRVITRFLLDPTRWGHALLGGVIALLGGVMPSSCCPFEVWW